MTIPDAIGRAAAALLALLALASAATAQETFNACYVPEVGAVYMIKIEGLPQACLAAEHVEFSWTTGTLGEATVTTTILADGAVTAAKLADGAVVSAKLADGAVTDAKLGVDVATQAELDSLAAAGTLNESTNPVDWTKLKSVPSGLADGTDDGFTENLVVTVESTVAAGGTAFIYATCPSGYQVTGGGGNSASDVFMTGSFVNADLERWYVTYTNTAGVERGVTVYALCVR